MRIYERNINTTVNRVGPDAIVTEASLLDLNHSMRVSIRINLKTRLIEEATAEIVKAPLGVCGGTTALLSRLQGLKLARGINAKLVEALGGEEGCTHLYELALNAVRLSFNVMMGLKLDWQQWVSKTIPDQEFIAKAEPFLAGACLPFKKP